MWALIVVIILGCAMAILFVVGLEDSWVDDPTYKDDTDFEWGMYPWPQIRKSELKKRNKEQQ